MQNGIQTEETTRTTEEQHVERKTEREEKKRFRVSDAVFIAAKHKKIDAPQHGAAALAFFNAHCQIGTRYCHCVRCKGQFFGFQNSTPRTNTVSKVKHTNTVDLLRDETTNCSTEKGKFVLMRLSLFHQLIFFNSYPSNHGSPPTVVSCWVATRANC